MCKCEHLRDHLVLPSILWRRTDPQRVRDLLHVAPLSQGWDPSFLPPGTHVWICVSPGINFGAGGKHRNCRVSKMGEGLLASLLLLFLSLLRGADIAVETDMLLSLLQSPVADPEREALARKVSCKPSLRRPPEVSVACWVWSQEACTGMASSRPRGGRVLWGPGASHILLAKPGRPLGHLFLICTKVF